MDRNTQAEAALIASQVEAERNAKYPFITEDMVDEVLEWEEQRTLQLERN